MSTPRITLRRAAAAKTRAAARWAESDARLCEAVLEASEAGVSMIEIASIIGVTREHAYNLRAKATEPTFSAQHARVPE